jgi:hypothetical protein
MHSAKGLEYDVVFLLGMDQGRLPSWRDNTPDKKAEARRRLDVGLTRAKREVHLTYSGFTESRAGSHTPRFSGKEFLGIEVALFLGHSFCHQQRLRACRYTPEYFRRVGIAKDVHFCSGVAKTLPKQFDFPPPLSNRPK